MKLGEDFWREIGVLRLEMGDFWREGEKNGMGEKGEMNWTSPAISTPPFYILLKL